MPASATAALVCLTGSFEVAATLIPDCIHEGIHFWKTGGEDVVVDEYLVARRVLDVLAYVLEISLDELHEIALAYQHYQP